jgi:hypothetical protein
VRPLPSALSLKTGTTPFDSTAAQSVLPSSENFTPSME